MTQNKAKIKYKKGCQIFFNIEVSCLFKDFWPQNTLDICQANAASTEAVNEKTGFLMQSLSLWKKKSGIVTGGCQRDFFNKKKFAQENHGSKILN